MCNNSNCGCNNNGCFGFNNNGNCRCNNGCRGSNRECNQGCCKTCNQVKCNCCNNKCGKSCEWNRHCYNKIVDFTDVFNAIKTLQEALKGICNGVQMITKCCDLCGGLKVIKDGYCCLEAAFEDLFCALQEADMDADSCISNTISQAVCDIKEAIRCVCEGIKCIENSNICDGVKMVCTAAACANEGLCALTKGVRKVNC